MICENYLRTGLEKTGVKESERDLSVSRKSLKFLFLFKWGWREAFRTFDWSKMDSRIPGFIEKEQGQVLNECKKVWITAAKCSGWS